jgi:hypothetical protein
VRFCNTVFPGLGSTGEDAAISILHSDLGSSGTGGRREWVRPGHRPQNTTRVPRRHMTRWIVHAKWEGLSEGHLKSGGVSR